MERIEVTALKSIFATKLISDEISKKKFLSYLIEWGCSVSSARNFLFVLIALDYIEEIDKKNLKVNLKKIENDKI